MSNSQHPTPEELAEWREHLRWPVDGLRKAECIRLLDYCEALKEDNARYYEAVVALAPPSEGGGEGE